MARVIRKKREYIFLQKFIYTIGIFIVYIIGTNIPLYGIDVSKYVEQSINMDKFLLQTVSGDLNQCSIFNLGIFPYMISNLIVQVFYAFKSEESKKKVEELTKEANDLLYKQFGEKAESLINYTKMLSQRKK